MWLEGQRGGRRPPRKQVAPKKLTPPHPPHPSPLPFLSSHLAASEGCYKITEWLLAHKSPVNAVDRFRRTPLEEAVRGDFAEVAKLLVDHGGKIQEGGKVRGACKGGEGGRRGEGTGARADSWGVGSQ